MKTCFHPSRRNQAGYSLMELLLTVGLGSILLTVVAGLVTYGARTFVAMGNYVELDDQSRNAVDIIGREIRSASAVVSFQTNLAARWITLTNDVSGTSVRLTYDAGNRLLVFQKNSQPERILLTECDQWNFWLYDRAPVAANLTFHAATNGMGQLDPATCKVINMSWNCSRTILGAKLTTESVQTAQIVLRNKVE